MDIYLVNESSLLSDTQAFNVAWALDYQARYHYGRSGWRSDVRCIFAPGGANAKIPRGGSILHLLDTSDQPGALGYHDEDGNEVPYGRVFVKTAQDDGTSASEVASHELLELATDPHVNESALTGDLKRLYALEVGDPCLAGNTRIPLLDGSEIAISDLVGVRGPVWVYSITPDGQIRPGRAHSARLTREDAPVVEVTLDDGSSVRTTSDHRFMLRDGTYRQAGQLRSGDSLMPLYRRRSLLAERSNSDYEQVMVPAEDDWRFTHRLVQQRCPRGWVRHHQDFDRFNNSPENLILMLWEDHQKLHQEHASLTLHTPEQRALAAQRGAARFREMNEAHRGTKRPELCVPHKVSPEALVASTRRLDEVRHLANTPTQRAKAAVHGAALLRALWSDPSWRASKIDQFRVNAPRFQSETQKAGIAAYNASERGRAQSARNAAKAREALTPEWRAAHFAQPEVQARASQHGKRSMHRRWHEARGILKAECEFCESVPSNHKVLAVRSAGTTDVYDLTVDEYANFAVGAGVFVHNCQGNGYDFGAPEGRTTGVIVADFVLPNYFDPNTQAIAKTDFRGALKGPFALGPQGYYSFIDMNDVAAGWQQKVGSERKTPVTPDQDDRLGRR